MKCEPVPNYGLFI